jgi:dihydroorotase
MCDAPARVWDIVGKGRIATGYDADLVLVDLEQAGQTLVGWPVRTWVMGQEVYRAGRFNESCRGHEAIFDHARGGYWRSGGNQS